MTEIEELYCMTVALPLVAILAWRTLRRSDRWEDRWGRRAIAALAVFAAITLADAWENGLSGPAVWQRLWWKLA